MLAQKKNKAIVIPERNFQYAEVILIGDSPLLVHRFSEKAKQEILDKQMKVAKTAKKAKDPEECFKNSLYPMPGKKNAFGVPAGGLKKCCVSAASFIPNVTKTSIRAAFHIIAGPGNLIEILGSKPVMDESIVRIGTFPKVADIRYRARFDKWTLKFDIKYDADMVNIEQIANLFEYAGFSIGLCEWRPEKDGSYGMFHVAKEAA